MLAPIAIYLYVLQCAGGGIADSRTDGDGLGAASLSNGVSSRAGRQRIPYMRSASIGLQQLASSYVTGRARTDMAREGKANELELHVMRRAV